VDVWEVIKAATSKPFGYMPFYPGPGVGGHCIPVDPLYLSWKMKTLHYNSQYIQLASEMNAFMPHYVMDKITNGLNDDGKAVRGAKVVVLGVAYKRDIDDVRESPALDVLKLLHEKGAAVVYHDPFVAKLYLEDGTAMQNTVYSDDLLNGADCVVITTDHSQFDYQHVLDHAKLVVDTRHVTSPRAGKARVVLL
jgi:UDP-N-acetyl-D-glucosamine dehydrogenase